MKLCENQGEKNMMDDHHRTAHTCRSHIHPAVHSPLPHSWGLDVNPDLLTVHLDLLPRVPSSLDGRRGANVERLPQHVELAQPARELGVVQPQVELATATGTATSTSA